MFQVGHPETCLLLPRPRPITCSAISWHNMSCDVHSVKMREYDGLKLISRGNKHAPNFLEVLLAIVQNEHLSHG